MIRENEAIQSTTYEPLVSVFSFFVADVHIGSPVRASLAEARALKPSARVLAPKSQQSNASTR